MKLVFQRNTASLMVLTLLNIFSSFLLTGLTIIFLTLFGLQIYLPSYSLLIIFMFIFTITEINIYAQKIIVTNDSITFKNLFSSKEILFNQISGWSLKEYSSGIINGVRPISSVISYILFKDSKRFIEGYYLNISYKDTTGKIRKFKIYLSHYTNHERIVEIIKQNRKSD